MKIDALNEWLPLPAPGTPLVIAGPCSAESEEQVLRTAHALKEISAVKVFRAGIWKPRTRPNNFEGLGELALPWLAKVKKETGLLTTTEVATAKHVELCLKAGIDILWIGARTTANPFSVQEIADALKGVDIPVMVKNPINADLQLWIGALERMNQAGISKLVAIHRGFSVAEKLEFRNDPLWRIPMELKVKFPELPLLCDPSHITGKRELVQKVCQKAMDLDMNGLIIETHPDPDKAWSDASQQVTPEKLLNIISSLSLKREYSQDKNYTEELNDLREQIDRLDSELIHTLKLRQQVVEKIAMAKINQNITALQKGRFEELMKDRLVTAEKMGLSLDFIKEIFDSIHEQSVQIQTDLFEKNNK
ncbi:3-deoxy-7-phosphoheptulonate synthase [Bacteriovorax stolpii]|uniref:chorismate mutase n=1 Tax=Bacteriovorax stolpii TaxID=960 RepID=UPI00115AEEB5|nr:chorismate mutase [Bacteriovorax stolpii]QDK42886.1 3-deoxy-7-phosphoheptulonate synthase [Bacteriovorax stolpii]